VLDQDSMARPLSGESKPDSTGPDLKPLAPPRGCTNWIYKEPVIFEHLHERHVERQARKIVNLVYRRSLQALGEKVCFEKPSRGTFLPPEDSYRYNRAPRNRVFGPLPFMPQPAPEPMFRNSLPKSKSMPSGLSAVKDSEDQRAMILGDRCKMHQSAWRSLEDWSRHAHGAPFSLKQVYKEIEADCRHRRAKDTRPEMGTLGPELIGMGATRQRREKPHFKAKGDSTRARYQTAAARSAAMRSASSTATDVTLPAIADAKPAGEEQNP